MEQFKIVGDLVMILAVALVVVTVLHRVRIPTIGGFILAGILLGPRTFGLVRDIHEVEVLAEIGVVLLLFGIGLELSLDRLAKLWKSVVLGGALQLSITVAAATMVARALGVSWGSAIFIGCLLGISSTAIVLRGLVDRGELEAPHGKLSLGILVFQDLSVVPMILAIPILAGGGETPTAPVFAMLKALLVLVGVLVASVILVPRFLHMVARTRRRELFVLAVFVVCMGTAYAVSLAGISLSLGAFLAGMVVAGSNYRHQALSELIPFRDVLTSVFFVSVGMLVDPAVVTASALPLLGVLTSILVGKFLIVFVVALLMRLPVRVAALAGASLAQVGEFAFVLLHGARETTLLSESTGSLLVTAAILSMLVTPLLMAASPHIATGVGRIGPFTWLRSKWTIEEMESSEAVLEDHVIIAGYGVAGQKMVQELRARKQPYVVVDLNAETIQQLTRAGEPAFFGDVTSPEVLEKVGVEHARQLAIVVSDEPAVERAVRAARSLAPELSILVRTRWDSDVNALKEAGATEVISAEREGAQAMAQRAGRT